MLFSLRSDRRAAAALQPRRLLYAVYAARLSVCLAVYGSALMLGHLWVLPAEPALSPEIRLISYVGLVLAAAGTAVAYAYSHLRHRRPGRPFFYSQALLDIVLVTGIVQITGGAESVFPPLLYVMLASGYALLLPFGPAVGVALLTGAAYLGDIALFFPEQLGPAVFLQVGIFTVVASLASVIGGRLRQVQVKVARLEEELRRVRLEAIDLLQGIESAVLVFDRDEQLVYMNPTAETLLETDAQEWLGRPYLAQLDPRAPGVTRTVRTTLATDEAIRNRETMVEREEGRAIPVSVTTANLSGSEGGTVTLVLQDLRPLRRIEELKIRTNRLEAVAELSASLAHEIRNPLASIRSAVEQIDDRMGENGDENTRTLLRLIRRECDRLNRLLQEFGDFAQVDVSRRAPLDVERLFQEAVEVVRQHPDTPPAARFRTETRGNLEDLWGDPDLIHRILTNLMLNAVQAAAEERTPTVRLVADELRPDYVPDDLELGAPVRIRVMDDGPGIPPDELDRIFDPFYTTKDRGSGLGLSIAHRAVGAHRGTLTATSEPGEGATFTIVLPRRSPLREPSATSAERVGAGREPEEAVGDAGGKSEQAAGAEDSAEEVSVE